MTLTFCKFGRNFRFVAFIEKLRLWPNAVVFPQFPHLAIYRTSFQGNSNGRNDTTSGIGLQSKEAIHGAAQE